MIYSDYLVAVLPPKHPLDKERKIELQKLASESFILFHRVGAPGLFDEAVALCHRAGFSPNVRHETDLMTTVFLLVESGLGVSLAPSYTQGLEQQKTIRRPLTVQSNTFSLCAIRPRESKSPAAAALYQILRAQKRGIQEETAAECGVGDRAPGQREKL